MELFTESFRLHRLGLAILWLHPKSKRPIGGAWTSGPRKDWRALNASFEPGMNVGVRTGTPSQIGDNYLACIDVDVKDPKYRDVAIAKLKELLKGAQCPEVRSGSGNGSRHLYCVTKKPFKMITAAKSVETFFDPTGKKHHKWEICIYSDGRQMVLPPSVHPDTGKTYEWRRQIESVKSFPCLDFEGLESVQEKKEKKTSKTQESHEPHETREDFSLDETLDIRWLPDVPDSTRALVTKGLWKGKIVADRSAYLLPAAAGLLSAGLDKKGVLTVLTDRSTYLGECAYEHAKTDSRQRAAEWLWNYTVKRVVSERDPVAAFSDKAVEVAKTLNEEEAAAQYEEFRERPEDQGFHVRGPRGAMLPNYSALLDEFKKLHPYRTIADTKIIYIFNGTHYEDYTPYEVKAFAEEKFSPKPEERTRAEFLHKVLANHVVRRSFFTETTEGFANFQNGVFKLDGTIELTAHSPDRGFRGVLPYGYDPKARCPLFWKWINDLMCGDRELVLILQEFMGYIIRGGEYRFHKALWLEGTGRNGKSTFIDVLKALIGPGNYSTISIKALVGDKFMGAELDGKIANFSEETSPQELADSGPFKNLTGDGELSVQKKFGDPYFFRNRAKLVMSYNTIPDLKDLSTGMMSRPLIVPFRKRINEGEQDKQIKEKLFAELPGIFNFALRGWARLEKQGRFTASARSGLALQKIKEESCNVYQWVENYVVPTGDRESRLRPRDLYSAYCGRERYPYKMIEFMRRANAHPYISERRMKSNGERFYHGLRLT